MANTTRRTRRAPAPRTPPTTREIRAQLPPPGRAAPCVPASRSRRPAPTHRYFIHSPKNIPAGTKLPVILQIHGGGFTGGAPFKTITPEIAE